jgi:hypothetical protein
MFLGAIRDDRLARILRAIAAVGLAIACTAPLWAARTLESFQIFTILPIATALIYAKLIGDRTYYLAAGFALICWSARYGGFAYAALRKLVPGLDQITLGLAFFVVAALISLAKAGALESILRHQKPNPNRLATDPAS